MDYRRDLRHRQRLRRLRHHVALLATRGLALVRRPKETVDVEVVAPREVFADAPHLVHEVIVHRTPRCVRDAILASMRRLTSACGMVSPRRAC
jgi:hypothetical protein